MPTLDELKAKVLALKDQQSEREAAILAHPDLLSRPIVEVSEVGKFAGEVYYLACHMPMTSLEFDAGADIPNGNHAYATWYKDCVSFSYDGIPWRTVRSTDRSSTISGRTIEDLLVELKRWHFEVPINAYILRLAIRPERQLTLDDLRDKLQKIQPRADIGQFPTLRDKPIREHAVTNTIHLQPHTVDIYVLARKIPYTEEEWAYFDYETPPDENCLAFLTFYDDRVDFTHCDDGIVVWRTINIEDDRCVTIHGDTVERLLGEVQKDYLGPIPEDCFIVKVAYTRQYQLHSAR
jgi:hypothetical protein